MIRFYYTYDGPGSPVSLGGEHPWTHGPAAGAQDSFNLVRAKSDEYASMEPLTASVPAGPFDVLVGAWLSRPLAAQTLSGTVMGKVPLTVSAGVSAAPDMRIMLVAPDGSVRAWLFTGVADTSGGADQFPPFQGGFPAAVPSTTVVAGDRLRVELGAFGSSESGGTVTLALTAQLGDDLPSDVVVLEPLPTLVEAQSYVLVPAEGHPGLLTAGLGSTVLTEDPAHPGYYLIGA